MLRVPAYALPHNWEWFAYFEYSYWGWLSDQTTTGAPEFMCDDVFFIEIDKICADVYDC